MPRPKNRTVNKNQGRDQFVGDGPVTVNNAPSESVLDMLTPDVAENALHNAGSRANRHECLEGTRGGFIEKLGNWIENPDENGCVYWVNAGAGVGKTAVAQTLCEKYSGSLLAAAYFFSRSDPSRNSLHSFVPTIAYQLAKSPDLQPHLADTINTTLHSDPCILGADWKDQFKRLIYQPCSQVGLDLWKTLPRLIIIDGLDECMDKHECESQSQARDAWRRDGQTALLKIIQDSMTNPLPLPLRFLIFSRPEHTISNFFRATSIPDIVQLDMRELRTEADSDIYLYLCQEFARLVKERHDAHLDASWPGKTAIKQLTRMSDGHFIYVATAVKYVMDNNPSSPPQERLDILLSPKPSKYPDLNHLDKLYLQILQPFAGIHKQLLLPLLQVIITQPDIYAKRHATLRIPDQSYKSRRILAELLDQADSRHISIVLSRLRSVLYVPDEEHSEGVSVLHASFPDFLSDKRRSNDFHVESMDGPCYLDKQCQSSLRLLKRIMLQYENDQYRYSPREPPVIEAWAFNTWDTLVGGAYRGFGLSGVGAESLQAVDEFDVYRYVNMLNDQNYIQPLVAYYRWGDDGWGGFIARQMVALSRLYDFLTVPPSPRTATSKLNSRRNPRPLRSESTHTRNGPFFRFFEEDCVAVLPKQYREVCYLRLKLLIGCLWDPIGSATTPASYCGSVLPFPDRDEPGEGTLKIFPHDIPPSTLAQSIAVEHCEIWRFGRGPWGTFQFQQVTIVKDGWIPLSRPQCSDLYGWMNYFAMKQMMRAKDNHRSMQEQGRRKKQWGVVESVRRLLCLSPASEEGNQTGEGQEGNVVSRDRERVIQERERLGMPRMRY
ncbi:hypothetical protein V5O48_015899 [Marasmius crinis-equi]|uniref:Nephrocystin 3-like N-terminal domain-containing protein n=1 Tax=Marasmius crinis-equi TaxID=585013 RepID=A0ABR3ETB3_9AGAR